MSALCLNVTAEFWSLFEIPCNGILHQAKNLLPVHHSEQAMNSVELRPGGARAQCLVFYPVDNLYDLAYDLIKRHSRPSENQCSTSTKAGVETNINIFFRQCFYLQKKVNPHLNYFLKFKSKNDFSFWYWCIDNFFKYNCKELIVLYFRSTSTLMSKSFAGIVVSSH